MNAKRGLVIDAKDNVVHVLEEVLPGEVIETDIETIRYDNPVELYTVDPVF